MFGLSTATLVRVSAVAPVSTTMPPHEPGAFVVPRSVTGPPVAPPAISVPRTPSSGRAGSPASMSSVAANTIVVPGSIVTVTPGPTVRSPTTLYGPPAAVNVVDVHSTPSSATVGSPVCGSAPRSLPPCPPNRAGEFVVNRRFVDDTYSGFDEMLPLPWMIELEKPEKFVVLFHTSENATVNVTNELVPTRMPVPWLLMIEFVIVTVSLTLLTVVSKPKLPFAWSVQFVSVSVRPELFGMYRTPASPMLRDTQLVRIGEALASTWNPTVPVNDVPATRTPS